MLSNDIIEKAIAQLNPYPNGKNSHWICDCPFCGKKSHLYLQKKTTKRLKRSGRNASFFFDCKRCSENGFVKKLLNRIGQSDLIFIKPSADIFNFTKNTLSFNDHPQKQDLPQAKPPLGFRRVNQHPYCEQRGFEPWQYDAYNVGVCNLLPSMKKYVYFLVYTHGVLTGYQSRHVYSKEKLDRINETRKQKDLPKILRYDNSSHDFSSMLFGLDDVEQGDIVILCEGIFDKKAIDNNLSLNTTPGMSCCCTFGKKISQHQIELLKQKQVAHLIVFFDAGAIADIKKSTMDLSFCFEKVEIAYSSLGDPDEISRNEFFKCFNNRSSWGQFYFSLENKITS